MSKKTQLAEDAIRRKLESDILATGKGNIFIESKKALHSTLESLVYPLIESLGEHYSSVTVRIDRSMCSAHIWFQCEDNVR